MKIERVFRVAPSLVRVILRERLVSTNIVEGYLPCTPGRTQFVRLEPANCQLVLQSSSHEVSAEERTKIPTVQAEALLEASVGRIGYRRSLIRLGADVDAFLD